MNSVVTEIKGKIEGNKPDKPIKSRRRRTLTTKQLHYCRCRANGTDMTNSYREAYNSTTENGLSVNQAASKLDKLPHITARIDELISLKEQALIRSSVSLKVKVLSKLESFMDTATPQDASKIRAAELLGKSIGLFKDIIEDNRNIERTPEELTELLEAKLQRLLGKSGTAH